MNEKIEHRIILQMMLREPSLIEKYIADPERAKEDIAEEVQSAGFGKRKPSVSVGSGDIIFVKFTSEPRNAGKNQYEQEMLFADVIMLAKTEKPLGWTKEKNKIVLDVGDEASMNIGRHAALRSFMEKVAPLTGKCFVIYNKGKVKTAKGKASDYRIKQIDCPKD